MSAFSLRSLVAPLALALSTACGSIGGGGDVTGGNGDGADGGGGGPVDTECQQVEPIQMPTGDPADLFLVVDKSGSMEDPLETGQITLVKYACTTATYVSDVDCEIYENGVTFDLLTWNGSQWVPVVLNSTTDAYGKIVWSGLPTGSYVVDEHGSAPCYVTSRWPAPTPTNSPPRRWRILTSTRTPRSSDPCQD